jgi:AbrB family looped-hinge helix DNA binding protein
MRITSKGQVTIPQEVREKLGLFPQTEVEFRVEGNLAFICKAEGKSGRGQRLVERLRGRATVKLSTDEIMALTREA